MPFFGKNESTMQKKISHHVEIYRFDEDAKPPNGQDTIVAPRMGQNSPRWNTQVFYLDQNPWWICGLLSNPRCYFQGRTPQRFQRKAPTTVVRVFRSWGGFFYAQTNDETNKDTETKHRISRWRRMFSIWILRLSQKFDLTKRRPC